MEIILFQIGALKEEIIIIPSQGKIRTLVENETHKYLRILKTEMKEQACNIMAEGFRFMPLGSVRLRTFRLSVWVT